MKTTTYVLLLALLLLGLSLLNISCAGKTEYVQTPGDTSARKATPAECPTGGLVLTVSGVDTPVCNGLTGSAGTDGKDGSNGTTIGVVQFCPGTPSYPSTFLEVGLIINNRVYGVYSVNGGFMTYLPPGAYNSNAVGSSCNFVINSDNTITN